jgi:hypothetical protein
MARDFVGLPIDGGLVIIILWTMARQEQLCFNGAAFMTPPQQCSGNAGAALAASAAS